MKHDLVEILKQVKVAASNHRERLLKNESATRATLIDPILRAVGWDVANPHKVIVEASARRGQNLIRADYGLLVASNVGIVVEAKSLGEDLDSHRSQIVDYAYAFKIDNIFLTNGLVWEHYNSTSFNPKVLSPACVLNIKSGNLENVADYLESVLILRNEGEEPMNSLALQIEADEILNKLSMVFDQMYGGNSTPFESEILPTAAIARRLEQLLTEIPINRPTSSKISQTSRFTEFESLVTRWVCERLNKDGAFSERTTELYRQFQEDNAQVRSDFGLGWPGSSSAFGRCLLRIVVALGESGIEATNNRTNLGMFWTFQKKRKIYR